MKIRMPTCINPLITIVAGTGRVSFKVNADATEELAAMQAQMADLKAVKSKANGAATKSTVTKLTKRVAALEKKAKKA